MLPTHAELKSALHTVEMQLASEPDSVLLLFQRGNILELLGSKLDAQDTYSALLAVDPSHRGALNNLGNLLSSAGSRAEARKVYEEAVARNPDDPMSHVNFANLLHKMEEPQAAREHFEQALKLDPDYWQAHAGLSAILLEMGDAEQASSHRRAAFRGRCVIPITYRGEAAPIELLELVAAGPGNTRIKNFISDTVFRKYLVTTEFFDSTTVLPRHQLVVNAIGDADVAGPALAGALELLKHTTAPVINPPQAVLATGRCAIADRLSSIPGVITAKTITLSREALTASDADTVLLRHGFEFPLLLRTPGFHGGENFLLVETPANVPAALIELPGSELIAMQLLDARGADGKSRKYRVMMIDGKLYPLHEAISGQWKVHYYTAEMADNAQHRAEEAEFLYNMSAVLGPKAMTALKQIQTALALDYGGIDFGLNKDGEVLLFEANAAMAVLPPDADSRWDYRRPAVAEVCKAIHEMLVSRAQANKLFAAP